MASAMNPGRKPAEANGPPLSPVRVVPVRDTAIPRTARRRIDALAAGIRARTPRIDDVAAFGPGVAAGIGDGPAVFFGDIAEIPMMSKDPAHRLDYRMGWLARPGDVAVIGGPPCPAFEAYQRQVLAAPGIGYLNVDSENALPRRATPAICLCDRTPYRRLLDAVAGRGAVTLLAHITTGTTWALAGRMRQDTGSQVHVAGPPPLLSRLSNDKLWFGEVCTALLGPGTVPPKEVAHSASALTGRVAELARRWDRLVVKLPDSAGSAGNLVLTSREVRDLSPRRLYRRLADALARNRHPPRFPMLVEVWDANVLTSPSVQTWIPLPGDGPPVIEGLFEQVLSGPEFAFSGATLAALPEGIDAGLCDGAMQLATLFQRLGFFGRCSFDAIVAGPDVSKAAIHWIECNARWGGVSLPMSLVNRLAPPGAAPCYAIVQDTSDGFRPLAFADAARSFADIEPPGDLRTGVLFLSPNLLEFGTGWHFLSFGPDAAAASGQAERVIRRLLDRP